MNEITVLLGNWLHFLRIQPSGKTLVQTYTGTLQWRSLNKTDSLNLRTLARTYDDGRTRYLNKSNFYRTLINGERVRRKWLIYSESTGLFFSYVCKLFSCHVSLTIGFNDWKNIQHLSEQEGSTTHKECISAFCVFGWQTERLDKSLAAQIENEQDYWRNVLRRVVSVVKFLSSRGLPFWERDEKIGSNHNGNFLGIIELLAQYGAFRADHLHRFGNAGSGTPSYLSSGIFNEFLQLMVRQVWSTIVAEVSSAKYDSIIVDSTPDITHLDQLAGVCSALCQQKRIFCWTVSEVHCNGGSWRRTSDKQCHQHPERLENFN